MKQARAIAGTTILVAEDEYLIADDLTQELIGQGAKVVAPVATVAAAIAAIADMRPDLAILDINLRGESVFPLADLLAERGVPFVFATGYDAGLIPERFEAIARCEKPIRIKALLATLDRLKADSTERPTMPMPGSGSTA